MSIMPDLSDEERRDQLPEDNDSPFRPADDDAGYPGDDPDRRQASAAIDDTHQATDTNLDPQEIYDEGYAGAAEASEPNAGNSVVDYHPEADSRRTDVRSENPEDVAL
jgi:hypothetical protein